MEGRMGDMSDRRFKLRRRGEDEWTEKSADFYHQKNRQKYLKWKRYSKYITSCWHLLQIKQHLKTCCFIWFRSILFRKSRDTLKSLITAKICSIYSSFQLFDLFDNGKTFQPDFRVNLPVLDRWMSDIFRANLSPSPYCCLHDDW